MGILPIPQLKYLCILFSVFVAIAFGMTLDFDSQTWANWKNGDFYNWIFPLLGFGGLFWAYASSKMKCEISPFISSCLIMFSAFSSLAVSFWPYMLPYSLTIEEAAAPTVSLEFMFWGAIIMMPLVVFYFLKILLLNVCYSSQFKLI